MLNGFEQGNCSSFVLNMQNSIMSGGFRATILWNEVVRDFEANMKKKKHRYHLMLFEDTFRGKAASSFLLARLQENELFGSEINKNKVNLLLNKFLKAGVIENVPESNREFRSKGLYRFPSKMPLKDLTSTLMSSQNQRLPQKDTIGSNHFDIDADHIITVYRQHVQVGDILHIPVGVDCLHSDSKEDRCTKMMYSYFCEMLLVKLQNNRDIWRNKVINRITDVMGSSADKCLAELMKRSSMWPCINACLMRRAFERRRDLPDWVDESLKCLGFYGYLVEEDDIYEGYLLDVSKLLCGYISPNFTTQSICSDLSLTLAYLYIFLNELDAELKAKEDEALFELAAQHEQEEMEVKVLAMMIGDDDDNVSGASSMKGSSIPIEDAQDYLWKLTTPKRNGYYNKMTRFIKADEAKVCLETAFSGENPVTRLIPKSSVAGQTNACASIKPKLCSESRCIFVAYNQEQRRIRSLLRRVITLALEGEPKAALEETVSLLGHVCYKKKAVKWLQDVKFHAIHLLRLFLLFLPPRNYYFLEMSLLVLDVFQKTKEDGNEMYVAMCNKIFGCENFKCHAYKDILDFLILNRKELFKPFEIEQILQEENVSFFKENAKLPTQMPKSRPKAAKQLRIPLAENKQIPVLKSVATDFSYKTKSTSVELTIEEMLEKEKNMSSENLKEKSVVEKFKKRYPDMDQKRAKQDKATNTEENPQTKLGIRV